MTPSQVQTLFDYHYAAFDKIWDCVAGLSPAQFLAESDYSIGSIRSQLAHCMIVDIRWLARLQAETPPEMAYEDYPDQAALRREWERIRDEVSGFVRGLAAADLDDIVDLDFPDQVGIERNPRWQILLHVVNHGTDHRAQILARLHELGAPTFEQDLILHLWAS